MAFQGIGWIKTLTGEYLGVEGIPGRKHPALVARVGNDNVTHVLAYFRSEGDAEKAIKALSALITLTG